MLKHIFLLLSRFVSEPADTDSMRLKKVIGVSTSFLGMLVQLSYGLLYLAYQETAAGLVAIGGATLFFLSIFTVGIWKNYTAHGYFWMVISYIVVFGATILLGGIGNSGFFVIWLMLAPLMALVAHKQSTWQYWFIVAIGGMIGIGFLQPWLRSSNNLPSNVIFIVVLINTISYFSLMFFVLSYYIKQNQKLSQLVKEERNKADRLLLNILPLEIANLLKNGNQVIAERYDEVSILFADVVNFTQMSEKITPETLVALLNEVFSHIDLLVEKYGLEKIKTIGDCYMAASGVPVPRTDHAIMLTRLAMDIQSFINGRQFQGQQLTIRIGINSGAVVAGVIGRKKFIYDLWGDAVNTASRMESHGSAGCIQITASTMQLIQHQYICEPKGLMTIKGKGNIPVWHVLAKKAAEV